MSDLKSIGFDSEGVISVGTFTRRIKALLESEIAPCWVRGEVSNLRQQTSGHIYFTLKDAESQLSCVLFRADAQRQTLSLQDGVQVIVYGAVNVYAPRGNYQLIGRFVVEDGLGRLQMEFDRLKRKLQGEGLFDASRKRPLPLLPQRIGIITSPTGAAVQDFLKILQRRGWRGSVVVIPAKVQGKGAADMIVQGLMRAKDSVQIDLIVLARGGGSLEDLWCFNEESVVRAIAASLLPVISAVGHEIDFTLSDFVADVRAETPSAAAELISSGYLKICEQVSGLQQRLWAFPEEWVRDHSQRLELIVRRLAAGSPENAIKHGYLRVDDLANRLLAVTQQRLEAARTQSTHLSHRLQVGSPAVKLAVVSGQYKDLKTRFLKMLNGFGKSHREKLIFLGKRLDSCSVSTVLRRGFVLVRNDNGEMVTSSSRVEQDQRLHNVFFDGKVSVRVEAVDDISIDFES